MKDIIFDDFQNSVDECFLRHRSIIDITSKLQESQARTNRAVAKAITTCGCIQINADCSQKAEDIRTDKDLEILQRCLDSHIRGELCENCRDVLQTEIGNHLFYLTSLCNLLDLNMYDIMLTELNNISILGKYAIK